MSSYIKFMFEYLFQADQLASELSDGRPRAGPRSAPGAFSGKQVAGSGRPAEFEAGACQWLYELLLEQNKTSAGLRSLAEFEQFARHQLATLANATNDTQSDKTLADDNRGLPSDWEEAAEQPLLGNNSQSWPLRECFQQLQLEDYYSHYDIYVGLRIASTLTILFVVFILFVIYKTGCRGEPGSGRASRSQLQLTSFAGASSSLARGGSTSDSGGRGRPSRDRYPRAKS